MNWPVLRFQLYVQSYVKIARLSRVLAHWEITCLKGEAAICGARLLLVSRQVRAHLWHEGPAGGLSWIQTHNPSILVCLEVQALPLSHFLLLRQTNPEWQSRLVSRFVRWVKWRCQLPPSPHWQALCSTRGYQFSQLKLQPQFVLSKFWD